MRFASLGLLLVVLSSSPAIAENNSVRARLTPQQEAKLSSQMDGRILQYYVDAGESFAQGQKLIEFDCSEQQARLKVSQAQRSIADETYNTQRRLQSLQAVSELEVAVAKAELDKALAEVELNQVAIQRCQILAPYPGLGIYAHRSNEPPFGIKAFGGEREQHRTRQSGTHGCRCRGGPFGPGLRPSAPGTGFERHRV